MDTKEFTERMNQMDVKGTINYLRTITEICKHYKSDCKSCSLGRQRNLTDTYCPRLTTPAAWSEEKTTEMVRQAEKAYQEIHTADLNKYKSDMFSNRLRQLRYEKDISQRELAESIGVEQRSISKYETEESEPNFKKLIKMAEFFNVSTDYLLGLTDKRKG